MIENRRAFLINFAYFGVILLLSFCAVKYALPLLTPFAIGFFIAYILKKPIRYLREGLHMPGKLAAILTVILFYATAGLLLTLLGIKAVSGVVGVVGNLPTMYNTHVLPFFDAVFHSLDDVLERIDPALVQVLSDLGSQMLSTLGQMVSSVSVAAMGFATAVASAVPGLFIKLVLMIISTFFIAVDYDRLTGFCMDQLSDRATEVFLQIKSYVAGTLWVCIRSYLLIMSITFVELSVGLTFIGIEHAVLVALCIAVFDILPVLGTGGIMIPWGLLTMVGGDVSTGVKLLLIYLVITIIRNILEPKIVGGQLGLHPVVTLCSMFVGVQLLGGIGLFGFPIALSLLRYLNDHGVIKILK